MMSRRAAKESFAALRLMGRWKLNTRPDGAVAQMVKWRIYPSSPRRGGRDLNKISRSLLYGAGGVAIKFHRILLSLNTTITGCALSRLHSLRSSPSARAKDGSRLFDRAAAPPRRGGVNW